MPHCYHLCLCAGSSLDQQSNNITLFSLVEQVNVPAGAGAHPGTKIPLEIHAYLKLEGSELGHEFSMRYVLVGTSGLETYSDPAVHKSSTVRLRTRSVGIPFPPALGHYELMVEFQTNPGDVWRRDEASWPISFLEMSSKPQVTH